MARMLLKEVLREIMENIALRWCRRCAITWQLARCGCGIV